VSGVGVVDAGLAVKWLVREVHSDEAYTLARSWAQEDVYPMAPYLMPVEVANALYRRVIRQEISLKEATSLLNALFSTGQELNSGSQRAFKSKPWNWRQNSGKGKDCTHNSKHRGERAMNH
jgi:predicted nucleic acid-binding protein